MTRYTDRERRRIRQLLGSYHLPSDMRTVLRELDGMGIEVASVTRYHFGIPSGAQFGTKEEIPIDEYRKEMSR